MEYELDLENDMAYRLNDSGGVVSKLSGHDFLNLMKQNGGTLYRKGPGGRATGAILNTGANTPIFQALTTPRKAVEDDAIVTGTVEPKGTSSGSSGSRSRTSSNVSVIPGQNKSPAKSSPAKSSPAKSSPAKSSPAKSPPAKSPPAKSAPAKSAAKKNNKRTVKFNN